MCGPSQPAGADSSAFERELPGPAWGALLTGLLPWLGVLDRSPDAARHRLMRYRRPPTRDSPFPSSASRRRPASPRLRLRGWAPGPAGDAHVFSSPGIGGSCGRRLPRAAGWPPVPAPAARRPNRRCSCTREGNALRQDHHRFFSDRAGFVNLIRHRYPLNRGRHPRRLFSGARATRPGCCRAGDCGRHV